MKSLRELYRIGNGPSSSHTMAPRKAGEEFLARPPEGPGFRVTLYGSLAATGRGHLTDQVLGEVFSGHVFELHWKAEETLPAHPNGMLFEALADDGSVTEEWIVFSTGVGAPVK